jgi:hypothetical protein
MVFNQNHGEGGSSFVQYRPHPQSSALLTGGRASYPWIANAPFSTYLRGNNPLDMPIEGFLGSLRFEHRNKLDQLGIEIGSFGSKKLPNWVRVQSLIYDLSSNQIQRDLC